MTGTQNHAVCMLTNLVWCRWDLMKRTPKELLDNITARAQTSMIDDNAVREQYRECHVWQRYV